MNEEIKNKDIDKEPIETEYDSAPPEDTAIKKSDEPEPPSPNQMDRAELLDGAETLGAPTDEDEEEIIFPQKPENGISMDRQRPGFTLSKFLALALLIVGVYLLGYITNPEKFDQTVHYVKRVFSQAIEKAGPLEKKLTEIIEAKVKNKPAPNSTGSRTSGEETPLTSGKKIKYWQAPMNPSFISDEPGKSPMGMDLIPVYEDQGEEDEQVIRINPTITQNIGVKTETVKIRNLSRAIRTVGRLTYFYPWIVTRIRG